MTDAPRHEDFKGVWVLSRQVAHTHGRPARFEGFARITRAWTYLEWGNLEIEGADYAAGRRYEWAPVEGGFDVSFEDGRPFHDLRFAAPEARHFCDPDTYDVTYDFSEFPRWRSTWVVTGPRKDYRMESHYVPFSNQAAFLSGGG